MDNFLINSRPTVWKLIKLIVAVRDGPELYETESFIYQNNAVKEKA